MSGKTVIPRRKAQTAGRPGALGDAMALYAVGTFLQRIGALVLVPLYTSALLVSEYGGLETLTVIYLTFTIVINFGLSNALIRFYSECNGEHDTLEMVRTSWVTAVIFSLGFYFLAMLAFGPLASILFKDSRYGDLIGLCFLWAVGGALNQQYFAYYRARQEARSYVALSLLYFIASTALNIILVRFMNMRLVGVLLGNLIVVWGINVMASIKFFGTGRSISLTWAKRLLGFGVPLVVSMLGWLVLNSADRYFLAYYRDLTEVGMYGLGYKVGLIAQVAVVMPFQLAWGPFMFSQHSVLSENRAREYSRVLTYLLLGFSIISVGVLLFSNELIELLGSGKFAEAAAVVPYVLAAYLFTSVYYWSISFLHLKKKTAVDSAIVLTMAGVNLALNWLWTPIWGWKGAAWATVVAVGGTGVLSFLAGQWAFAVKPQYGRIMKLLSVVGSIVVIHIIVVPGSVFLRSLLSACLLLCMPVALYLLGFLETPEERFLAGLPRVLKSKLRTAVGWARGTAT